MSVLSLVVISVPTGNSTISSTASEAHNVSTISLGTLFFCFSLNSSYAALAATIASSSFAVISSVSVNSMISNTTSEAINLSLLACGTFSFCSSVNFSYAALAAMIASLSAALSSSSSGNLTMTSVLSETAKVSTASCGTFFF